MTVVNVEFEFDDERSGTEVRLGPRRRAWPVVLVLGIGAVVVASVASGGPGRDRAAPTSTAATTARTRVPIPTSASPATTDGSTTLVEPSTSTTAFAALPFGRPTGLVVYLTPSSGAPSGLLAYDVDRGVVHELDLGRDVGWYLRALDGAGGAVVDGGVVVLVKDGVARPLDVSGSNGIVDGPNGRTAPGPAGGVWVRGFEPPAVELVDASGARTGRRYALPPGAELYGAMDDGRPVVRGDDRVAYAVEPDGTRAPLDGIPIGPVERGRYVEVRCDAAQACTAFAHLGGDVVALGPTYDDGGPRAYEIEPDGPYVAVMTGVDLSLLDTRTGHVRPAVVGLMGGGYGPEPIPARFLPDGLGLVAQTQRGFVFVGLDGHMIADLSTGAAIIPGAALLGVGRAQPWHP